MTVSGGLLVRNKIFFVAYFVKFRQTPSKFRQIPSNSVKIPSKIIKFRQIPSNFVKFRQIPSNSVKFRTLRFQNDFQKNQKKNTFPRPSLKIRISRLRENAGISQGLQGGGEAPHLGDHLHSSSNTREIRISSDGIGKDCFGIIGNISKTRNFGLLHFHLFSRIAPYYPMLCC